MCFGVDCYFVMSDWEIFCELCSLFDVIFNIVSVVIDFCFYFGLFDVDGMIVCVGVLVEVFVLNVGLLIVGCCLIVGLNIGGICEM